LTSGGEVVLSSESAAPELVRGEPATVATDVYALGVLAYTLLAGRAPFVGERAAVLHAHLHTPPPPLSALRPDLPAGIGAATNALAKDPRDRPPSAGALAAAL